MLLLRTLIVVLSVSVLVGTATSSQADATPTPDPRGRVETTIQEMIRLLEAKEYRKLVEEFVVPEELEQFRKDNKESAKPGGTDFDELIKEFGGWRATSLLKNLKGTTTVKPEYSDEGNTAIFTIPNGNKRPYVLKFHRIDKRWYLSDE